MKKCKLHLRAEAAALAGSPIGFLPINLVMKPDIPANRLFAGLGVRRQDFQNLSPLIFVRVTAVNQRIRKHHNLHDVSAAWAPNADPPAVGEFYDLLVVKGKFVNAVRAGEERDTCSEFRVGCQ